MPRDWPTANTKQTPNPDWRLGTRDERISHFLERMRHWLARSEQLNREWTNGQIRAIQSRMGDTTTGKYDWDKSPTGNSILASGVWAHRKVRSYAAAVQAEIAAAQWEKEREL